MAPGGCRRLADGPQSILARAAGRALNFGSTLHRYARLPSTQIAARRLAEAGAAEGTVVVAVEQTAGKGRLGSSFASPPGGLYCSVVLRPRLAPAAIPLISLAAGLSVAQTVQAMTGLTAVLKWPNDVLLDGRKVSGVLVELRGGGRGQCAILGIGLNVNVPLTALPADLRVTATSLLEASGRELSIDDLLRDLLGRCEAHYSALQAGDGQALLDTWRRWPNVLGRNIRAGLPEGTLEGVAEDLDLSGALLLRLPDGSQRRLVAADVHLLPEAAPAS